MSDSIAGLSFNVDSSQTVTAAQNLQSLGAAADSTAESQDRFNAHTQRFIAVAHDLSGSLAELRQQYRETSSTIDQAVSSLDLWQQKITQSASSFSVFDDARKHVDALGAAFGATSTAIQLFYDRSQQLTLNSGETTTALQRITDAIQGQTAGGLSVRHDLNQLGIDPGSDTNNSDQVLSQLVARLRSYQDTAQKTRLANEFGIYDPDTVQKLSEPAFIPLAQQRQLQYERDDRSQLGETTRYASQQHTVNQLHYDQRTDLEGTPGLFHIDGRYNLGNLSDEQSGALGRQLGLPSGRLADQSNDNRLTALQYLQAHPDSAYAQRAETLPSQIGDYVRDGYIGREYRYLTSGNAAANQAGIIEQEQGRHDAGEESYLGSLFNSGIRRVGSLFTPSQRFYSNPDSRPLSPQDNILRAQSTAETLSNAGYDDIVTYQEAQSKLSGIDNDFGFTRSRFEGAYGGQEGDDRYGQYRQRLQGQSRDSRIGDVGELRQAQTRRYVEGFAPGERDEAQAFLQFAAPHADLTQVTGGTGPTTLAGLLSSGVATGGQARDFTTAYSADRSQQSDAAHQAAVEAIDSLNKLATAAGQGATALDLAKVRQDAVNEALARGDPNAGRAGDDAVRRRQASDLNSSLASIEDDRQRTNDGFATSSARYAAAGLGGAAGAKLARDAGTDGQYAEQLRRLATEGGQEGAISSLQTLIDHIKQLGDVSAQAAADAANLSATQNKQASTSVALAAAAAPPGQRALIQALGPAYQANLNNPALFPTGGRPALSGEDIGQISDSVDHYPGVSLGLATGIAGWEGGGDPRLANPAQITAGTSASLGFSPPTSRADSFNQLTANLWHLGQDPSLQGNPAYIAGAYNRGSAYLPLHQLIASGGSDFSGYTQHTREYPQGDSVGLSYVKHFAQPSFQDYANSTNPEIQGLNSATAGGLAASNALAERNAADQFSARNAPNNQVNALLASGQSGAAALAGAGYLDPLDPNGAANARRRQAGVHNDQDQQFARTVGDTQQQIQSENALTAAYGQSYAAIEKANEANQTRSQVLQLARGSTDAQTLAELNHAAALAKSNQAAAEQHMSDQSSIDTNNFQVNQGIAPDVVRQRDLANYTATQTAQQKFPDNPAAQAGYVSDQSSLFDSAQAVQNMQKANEVVKTLGDTILDTFSRGLQGGESFKHLVGDMFVQIGSEIEKSLLGAPLERGIQSLIGGVLPGGSASGFGGGLLPNAFMGGSGGGLLGFFGNLLGFGNTTSLASTTLSGPATQTIYDQLDPIPTLGTFAKGGVFSGGFPVRGHAVGSIVNTPTPFTTADGGANVMGEAGPEAIVPLQTMPNGSLGIATNGGGGGGGMMFHMPITIMGNTGGGSNGAMDPSTAKKTQMQIQQMLEASVQAVLLKQGRPGGSLYNMLGQQT